MYDKWHVNYCRTRVYFGDKNGCSKIRFNVIIQKCDSMSQIDLHNDKEQL